MKKYTTPEIEMIVLQSADCITFNSGDYTNTNQLDTLDFGTFFGSGS